MRYILLDFEWNNAYSVPHKRFLNEITQIGAVMLDERLEVIDVFDVVVRSALTKRLRRSFTELTGITNERMLAGVPFGEAVARYRDWARVGDDTITMTWSNSDLYAVTENIRNFQPDGAPFPIGNYIDLQSFVMAALTKRGVSLAGQISLAHAAELFSISTEPFQLHSAPDDCAVCAALLRQTFDADALAARVLDTDAPDFFERLTFKPHYLKSAAEVGSRGEELRFACEACGAFAKRVTKWHAKGRWLFANFRCPDCGNRFRGKVMLKRTYDDLIIQKRIVPPLEEAAEKAQAVPDEMQRLSETV